MKKGKNKNSVFNINDKKKSISVLPDSIMPVPDISSISPFLNSEPFIPRKAPNEYYFKTLLRWISQNKFQLKDDIITLKHFPEHKSSDYEMVWRDGKISTTDEAEGNRQLYSPIKLGDLSEQNGNLASRTFASVPSHHIFLIAILDSLRTNFKEFIFLYAVNKNVEEILK